MPHRRLTDGAAKTRSQRDLRKLSIASRLTIVAADERLKDCACCICALIWNFIAVRSQLNARVGR
jgi:ribosomal protein S26